MTHFEPIVLALEKIEYFRASNEPDGVPIHVAFVRYFSVQRVAYYKHKDGTVNEREYVFIVPSLVLSMS